MLGPYEPLVLSDVYNLDNTRYIKACLLAASRASVIELRLLFITLSGLTNAPNTWVSYYDGFLPSTVICLGHAIYDLRILLASFCSETRPTYLKLSLFVLRNERFRIVACTVLHKERNDHERV